MVHPYTGTLFSNKKAQIIDISDNLDEFQGIMLSDRKQSQKVT